MTVVFGDAIGVHVEAPVVVAGACGIVTAPPLVSR